MFSQGSSRRRSPIAWAPADIARQPISRRRRTKPHRARPRLEALEERRLLTVGPVVLGGLQFFGDFTQTGDIYSADTADGTPITLGLAPGQGDTYSPLLQIENGSVSFDGNTTTNPGLAFSVTGSVDAVTDPNSPESLWQGLSNASFAGSSLLSGGFSTANGLPAGETLSAAGVNFDFDSIVFNDPDDFGGQLPQIELQGQLTIEGLEGLSLVVDGPNDVVLDDEGTNLTGVESSITQSFSTFGLTIGATSLNVPFEPNNESFAFYGGITVTTDDQGMNAIPASLGTVAIPGLVVEVGFVSQFAISLDSEIEVFGLAMQPDGLSFAYVTGTDYVVYGSADLTVGGSSGTIDATLGDAANPGILISGGNITQVAMALEGPLDVGGIFFEAVDLALAYSSSSDAYEMTGSLDFPNLLFAHAQLGAGPNDSIMIQNGAFVLENVQIVFEDIFLGAFMIDDLIITYSSDAAGTSFDVSLKVWFPAGFVVDGTVGFNEDGELNTLGLGYSGPGLPIGDTGVFITGFQAEVQNLEQPSSLIVSGSVALTYQPNQIEIAGVQASIVKVIGGFTADKDELILQGDVYLGAVTDPATGNTSGLLGEGSGTLTLDWATETYSLDIGVSMWADIISFDVSFTIADDGQDIYFRGEADVNVPDVVPFIGGDNLAGLDFAFVYLANQPASRSYVAAWVEVDLIVKTFDIGFKANFDGSVSVLSNSQVDAIKHGSIPEPGNFKYFASFPVPNGATHGTFEVAWPTAGGTQSIAIVPPGGSTPIDSSAFSLANGLSLVPELDTDTTFTVHAVGSSSDPDAPLPQGEYQLILTSTVDYSTLPIFTGGFGYPLPTIAIGSIPSTSAELNVPVPITATADEAFQSQTTISLFLDDDGAGFNGVPVVGATGLPFAETFNANWNLSGLLPIPYQLYAVIDDGFNKPVFTEVYSTPLTPEPPLSGNISDSENGGVFLSGFLVYLDLNHNGRYDPETDPSSTTNADGFYAFYDLTPGITYDVTVLIPTGYQLAAVANNSNPAVRTFNGTPVGADFDINELGTIEGTVYNDLNDDGSFDPSIDPGLQGWQVFLDANGNGRLDSGEVSTYTNASGYYTFFNVAPDSSFTVGLVLQTNYFQTQPLPAPPGTWSVSTPANIYNHALGNNFGVIRYSIVSGTLTSGAWPGLGGWTVELLSGTQVIATTQTASDGSYSFTQVRPGSYTVREVVPSGWRQFLPLEFDSSSLPAPPAPNILGQNATTADLDGDGNQDIVSLGTSGPVNGDGTFFIYFGNGNGTFSGPLVLPSAIIPPVVKVVSVDLFGTGRLDLAMINAQGFVTVVRNNGNRQFTIEPGIFTLPGSPGIHVIDLVTGDFNNDGADDLAASYLSPGGAGGFAVLTMQPQHQIFANNLAISGGLAAGDVNNDGNLDLLINGSANSANTTSFTVAYGNGTGQFPTLSDQDVFFVTNGGPIALGDINGDGLLDAAFGGMVNEGGSSGPVVGFAIQAQGGIFEVSAFGDSVLTPTTPGIDISAVFLSDLTDDFTPDLIAVVGGAVLDVFINTGGGFLQGSVVAIPVGNAQSPPIVPAIADLNGEGVLDIVAPGE